MFTGNFQTHFQWSNLQGENVEMKLIIKWSFIFFPTTNTDSHNGNIPKSTEKKKHLDMHKTSLCTINMVSEDYFISHCNYGNR